ncbi:SRPBCC family protein [Roseitranquillus sediminis]|uniref:SRPBCC family protein n=1 Tax=Roseitranquillus sediminis TaxID=2809051 RepID=UPI001D0C277E|nr:SRPBCC family protein [Roseitranquillus sediminis]MBM9593612.1 SRPBCC family protein [Roseitranquillus sediminis]
MDHLEDLRHSPYGRGDDNANVWLALGVGALLGAAGLAWYTQQSRRERARRPGDSAPGRTARQSRFGRYAVTGRTVTIAKPKDELYAFWRDFSNLPKFMENVLSVTTAGDVTRWEIAGPAGRSVHVETRVIEDRAGEQIAWRATESSQIDTEGKVMFRDAPGGRGTEVEAIVAYRPPAGELGRWIAKLFQREPAIQGRRELKRLKMLMETGEIATSELHKSAA